jgi:dUTPase
MGAPHPITTCYNMQGIYEIKTGDKIAQLIPKRRHKALIVTGKATDIGEDRGGGFGHSGV